MRDSFLHFLFGKNTHARGPKRQSGTRHKSLKLESLEDRHMLSVSFETPIANNYAANSSGIAVNPDLAEHRAIFSADFNNDGKADLLTLARYQGTANVYINNGASTNALSLSPSGPFSPGDGLYKISSAAVGKLDGDNNVDLLSAYVLQENVFHFSVFRGNGSGGFYSASVNSTYTGIQSFLATQGVTVPPNASLFTEISNVNLVNNNGRLDMICTGLYNIQFADGTAPENGTFNLLFTNDGNGNFKTAPTVINTSGRAILAAGDLTGNGKADYVVRNEQTTGQYKLDIYIDGTTKITTPNYGKPTTQVVVSQCHSGNKMEIVTALMDGTGNYICVTTVTNNVASIGELYKLDIVPANIVTGDFNNDGYIDILVSDGNFNQTLLGKSDGKFQKQNAVIASAGFLDSCVADFDGDGKADVLAVGKNFAWLIPGDTAKSPSVVADFTAMGITAKDVAFGDFNGDGKTDFAVLSYDGTGVHVFSCSKTAASFTRSATLTASFGTQLLVANFDNANGDDIVVFGIDDNGKASLQTFLSTSAGGFGSVKTTTLADTYDLLAVGKVDGDAYVDIVAIRNGNIGNTPAKISSYQVLLNNSANPGTFTTSTKANLGAKTTTYPTAVAIADMNGDGKNDLVLLDADSKQVWILPQAPTGNAFYTNSNMKTAAVTGLTVDNAAFSQLIVADFNADSVPDVLVGVVTSSGNVQFRVMENDPANKGTLKTETNFTAVGDFNGANSAGLSFSIGLLDQNGTPDVVIVGGNTVKRLINANKSGAETGTVTLVFRDYSSKIVSTEIADLSTLSDRLSFIDEWSNFWVEIWANTGTAAGVSSFNVTLSFNADVFEVRTGKVEFGSAFTGKTPTISSGKIALSGNVSGSALQGDNTNTLLARVSFMPVDVLVSNDIETGGLLMNFFTSTEYIAPQSNGFSVNSGVSTLTTTGGATGSPKQTANSIPLFPMIYDVNDSGKVYLDDFAYFALCFDKTITATTTPSYIRMFDYDHNGKIDLDDFVCFQQNFRLELSRAACRANPNLKAYYPAGFPGDFVKAKLASAQSSILSDVIDELDAPLVETVVSSTQQQSVANQSTQNQALMAYVASQESAKKDTHGFDGLNAASETERLLAEGKL